jgi:hypothetical protein
MKILDWKSENFCCAMVEDEERQMWTTTSGIAVALGIEPRSVLQLYQRRKAHFDELSGSNRTAKEEVLAFLAQHQQHFGIRRMRPDLHLWSEDDVLTMAVLCNSPQALRAKKEFLQFIKSNMRREYATLQTQYDEVLRRLMLIEEALPAVQKLRSAAGVSLAACRGSAGLRDLN